jgi:nickel-dependent lactate racemase
MRITFPYGRTTLSENVPESLTQSAELDILRPSYPSTEWSPEGLPALLESPISAPAFSEFLTGADSLLVVLSDHTRPVLYDRWLPALVSFALSVRSQLRITFLVATGTHPPESVAPGDILPSSLSGRFPAIVHSADPGGATDTRFASLGTTSRGTPVSVNRLLLETDRILATGAVNFHYYAGFTGGRKALVPGCASRSTIEANHSLVLSLLPSRGRHPQARSTYLALNPVSEDLAEAVSLLPTRVFMVNAIVSPDRRLLSLVAGGLGRAHRFASSLLLAWGDVPVSRPYDLVIASAGGYPHDISYYQAHKAFDAVHRIVSPGGRVILLAQMPNGIGDTALADALAVDSLSALEEQLRSRFDHAVQIAFSHRYKLLAATLCLVTDLPPESGETMGAFIAPDIPGALATLGGFRPQSIAVVPSAAGLHFSGVAARQ